MVKFTRKSKLAQMTSCLDDSDTKSYQTRLEFWGSSIKEDFNRLLLCKRDEEDSRENSFFKTISTKISQSVAHREIVKRDIRVLDSCSMYDYEMTWKQARKIGNSTIFQQDPEYQRWRSRTDSCTLIYKGKLGSGKSVLMANIVDDLNLHVQDKDSKVAYFFCRHDLPESLKVRTVAGALTRQLLREMPNLSNLQNNFTGDSLDLDLAGLLELLRNIFPPAFRAYFVLDGLDECDKIDRDALIKHLSKVQEILPLSLCVSLRAQPNNASMSKNEQFKDVVITAIPEQNPDIEQYVSNELERSLGSGELVVGDPTIVLEICEALIDGAEGMFLWVFLQFSAIYAQKTDESIRHALKNLPKGLSKTFARILLDSDQPEPSYQLSILKLVVAAQRPLTIEELREALSVVPGDSNWDYAKLINDIYSVLSSCGGLITVDEEDYTVRLLHASVKQFLLDKYVTSSKEKFTMPGAYNRLADAVITYLNYGIFDTQLSTAVIPPMKTAPVVSNIINTTLDTSAIAGNLAIAFLKSRRKPNYDISKTLAEARSSQRPSPIINFHFHTYAKSNWIDLMKYISVNPKMGNQLVKLMSGQLRESKLDARCRDTLLEIVRVGDFRFLQMIQSLLSELSQIQDDRGRSLLSLAVALENQDVIRALCPQDILVPWDYKDVDGLSPLAWAARSGNAAVVSLLLDNQIFDGNSQDNNGWTPLHFAVTGRYHSTVDRLLRASRIQVNCSTNAGATPLMMAAAYGFTEIVRTLLQKSDIDIQCIDNNGQSAGTLALRNGHPVICTLIELKKCGNILEITEQGTNPKLEPEFNSFADSDDECHQGFYGLNDTQF